MWRIIKAGISFYYQNKFGRLLLFLIIPIPFSILQFIFAVSFFESFTRLLIPGISIFVGFQFSMILMLAAKGKSLKDEIEAGNGKDKKGAESSESGAEVVESKKAFLNTCKNLISQLSFCILISLVLIIILFSENIIIDFHWSAINTVLFNVGRFSSAFLTIFLALLIIDTLYELFDYFMTELKV